MRHEMRAGSPIRCSCGHDEICFDINAAAPHGTFVETGRFGATIVPSCGADHAPAYGVVLKRCQHEAGKLANTADRSDAGVSFSPPSSKRVPDSLRNSPI